MKPLCQTLCVCFCVVGARSLHLAHILSPRRALDYDTKVSVHDFGARLLVDLASVPPRNPSVRDAKMKIKMIFERSSQRRVGKGFDKRVNRGPTLKLYCRPKAQEKQHFGKSHCYCRRFSPGNTVTIILDNFPPSTLQGVGLGGRKNPRIIVGESSCHFAAS